MHNELFRPRRQRDRITVVERMHYEKSKSRFHRLSGGCVLQSFTVPLLNLFFAVTANTCLTAMTSDGEQG